MATVPRARTQREPLYGSTLIGFSTSRSCFSPLYRGGKLPLKVDDSVAVEQAIPNSFEPNGLKLNDGMLLEAGASASTAVYFDNVKAHEQL